MLKPYRQIEENEQYTIYEFKTVYLYAMYIFLITFLVGCLANIEALSISGGVLILLYFLLVSTQYMSLGKKIKRATRESSVEMSGSKWSFSNPLTVKIRKEFI